MPNAPHFCYQFAVAICVSWACCCLATPLGAEVPPYRDNAQQLAREYGVAADDILLAQGDADAMERFQSLFTMASIPIEGAAGNSLRYMVFAPDGAPPANGWPLIMWLHPLGDGESNQWLHFSRIATTFFPAPWERSRYPFCFVSVLCPRSPPHWNNSLSKQKRTVDIADDVLALVMKNYPIDDKRVTLVGASMGGAAAFELAARHPQRFSAIVPTSPSHIDLKSVSPLKETTVWTFQCRGDRTPVDKIRTAMRDLKAAGGHCQLTEFDSSDHDSLTPAIQQYPLVEWLLARTAGESAPSFPGPRQTAAGLSLWEWSLLSILPAIVAISAAVVVARRFRFRSTTRQPSPR